MKIQILYILNCPWCLKTKKLIRQVLKELKTEADIEEILIGSEEKAKNFKFLGSPTVRINGKDVQEEINKARCLPCERTANLQKDITEYIQKECQCGCRIYFYKGKKYPYPPKEMIKETIKKAIKRTNK